MLIENSLHVLDAFLAPAEPFSVYHMAPVVQPIYTYDLHYPLEFGILLSGRQRRLCGEWSEEIGPGEVWFQGVWEPHGAEILEEPTTLLVFAVSPQCLATTCFEQVADYDWMAPFVAPPAMRPQTRPEARTGILAVASKAVTQTETGGDRAKLLIWLYFLEMMLLARERWTAPATPGRRIGAESYQILDRAVELVLSSRHAVSLHQAARVCGTNANALNRLFRDLMGITFARYCLRRRLSGGAAQLAATSDPVKAIAKEWGFSDASHFHRCFQAQYGCTPAEYRARRQSLMTGPE